MKVDVRDMDDAGRERDSGEIMQWARDNGS